MFYFDKYLLLPELGIRKRFEYLIAHYQKKILRMPKKDQSKIEKIILQFEKEYDAFEKKKDEQTEKIKKSAYFSDRSSKTMRFTRYKPA